MKLTLVARIFVIGTLALPGALSACCPARTVPGPAPPGGAGGGEAPRLVAASQSLDDGRWNVLVRFAGSAAGTAGVAQLRLDVVLPDGTEVESVAPGDAAVQASKKVVHAKRPDGAVRVVVFGIGRDVVRDGEIVRITARAPAASKRLSVVLRNVVAATPNAASVSVSVGGPHAP